MENYSTLPVLPQPESQLQAEWIIALERTPPSVLLAWATRSAKRLVSVSAKHMTHFGSLLTKVTALSADELASVILPIDGGYWVSTSPIGSVTQTNSRRLRLRRALGPARKTLRRKQQGERPCHMCSSGETMVILVCA